MTDWQALHARAEAAQQRGALAEADALYRQVLAVVAIPEILVNHGNVLGRLGRPQDALAQYDRALAANPRLVAAHFNRGNALQDLRRHEDALESYDQALALQPDMAGIWNNRGATLRALNQPEAALASFQRAVALAPGHLNAGTNCAIALRDLKHFDAALAATDRVLAMRPDFAEALYVRANTLNDIGQVAAALEFYTRTLTARPDHPHTLNGIARSALVLCDWKKTAALAPVLAEAVMTGRGVIQPFTLLGYSDDMALQRRCAENYVRRQFPPRAPLWRGERYGHDRIRLAYLSADFHQHPTALLAAELFERHDRARFSVIAISFGPDDGSATRARLVQAFDRFEDVRGRSDQEVARLLRESEIDIAIDLNGHTLEARTGILGWRPCPVQVNWLGYPGTIGADFIDALIADPVVLPRDRQAFITERIVHLPDCYQPNDATRRVASPPTRAQAGLPETGFVFGCFNASWKIAAPVFDIWMRLLERVAGSVLWLLDSPARENLMREAAARGIDPARLVFAPKLPPDAHLARQQLIDLFLDTLPYGAHTTASDALWAGVPLLTCQGHAFPGRVGASLLTALEMPELIADSLAAYEQRALDLVQNALLLRDIREKLARNRRTAPLFDSDRFRRSLEEVYRGLLTPQ